MIKDLTIQNFRGISSIELNDCEKYNLLIGDNGTSKTSILEAINYGFSPSYLSGRIKHTDFHNGKDEPISINVKLQESITVELPDGYNTQSVSCNGIQLTIKKRERKTPGKVFSDIVSVDHTLVPDFPKDTGKDGWSMERKSSKNKFIITSRSLTMASLSRESIPRSFYFGKERDRQLHHGYNSSMSTIADDLNWKLNKQLRKISEDSQEHEWFETSRSLSKIANNLLDFDKSDVFKELKKKTTLFGLEHLGLSLIDALAPFDSSFFSVSNGRLDLPVKHLGSGIEMIISLLLLETLATISNEQLLILIDEPELHLHPLLQEKLSEYLGVLAESGAGHQIFISTHSPIFYKNTVNKPSVKTYITKRGNDSGNSIQEMSFLTGFFPWSPSWGEVNFCAFQYPSVEFHNELYGYIQEKYNLSREKNVDEFFESRGMDKNRRWVNEASSQTNNCTIPVFIRNKIHHPENKTMRDVHYTDEELEESIQFMMDILTTDANISDSAEGYDFDEDCPF